MFLYPRAMVLAVVPIFFFLHMVVLPAPVFLGIWFLIQLVQGVASVTDTMTTGVAWWAHIGGFAIGAMVAWALRASGGVRTGVDLRRRGMERPRHYWRGR
jgi:membrane associated rhomboid family serine protease